MDELLAEIEKRKKRVETFKSNYISEYIYTETELIDVLEKLLKRINESNKKEVRNETECIG